MDTGTPIRFPSRERGRTRTPTSTTASQHNTEMIAGTALVRRKALEKRTRTPTIPCNANDPVGTRQRMARILSVSVSNCTPKQGAYGLGLLGISPSIPQLLDADAAWPSWEIRWERYLPFPSERVATETWDDERASLDCSPVGRVHIERQAQRTTFLIPDEPSPDALVHPYLASTAIVAGHWLGRASFHAGAFALNGQVWGLLGERTMGKTSTLMLLHEMGIPVVSDDVLVIEDLMAFSGPRCLDLREDVASHTGQGRYIGVVGTRERWRVDLPTLPVRLPMGGWILLEWSDGETEISTPSAATRMKALVDNRGLLFPNAVMHNLLDLVGLPALRFSRPHAWGSARAGLTALMDVLSGL